MLTLLLIIAIDVMAIGPIFTLQVFMVAISADVPTIQTVITSYRSFAKSVLGVCRVARTVVIGPVLSVVGIIGNVVLTGRVVVIGAGVPSVHDTVDIVMLGTGIRFSGNVLSGKVFEGDVFLGRYLGNVVSVYVLAESVRGKCGVYFLHTVVVCIVGILVAPLAERCRTDSTISLVGVGHNPGSVIVVDGAGLVGNLLDRLAMLKVCINFILAIAG